MNKLNKCLLVFKAEESHPDVIIFVAPKGDIRHHIANVRSRDKTQITCISKEKCGNYQNIKKLRVVIKMFSLLSSILKLQKTCFHQ